MASPAARSPASPPARSYKTAEGRIRRACDACHARKIRCDRKSPCLRCSDMRLPCQRNRPRNVRRQGAVYDRDPQQHQELLSHIRRLEQSLQRRQVDDVALRREAWSPTHSLVDLEQQQQPSTAANMFGQARSASPPQSAAAQSTTEPLLDRAVRNNDQDFNMNAQPSHYSNSASSQAKPESTKVSPVDAEADRCLRQELQSNTELTEARRQALETAMLVAAQMAGAAPISKQCKGNGTHQDDEPLDVLSLDVVQCALYLAEPLENPQSYHFEFGSVIPAAARRQMASSLLNGSVDGQQRLQYLVCTRLFSYSMTCSLESIATDVGVLADLRRTKMHHGAIILGLLDKVGIMTQPTLELLQAIIAGAFVAQDLGEVGKFAILAANACYVLLGLGVDQLLQSDLDGAQMCVSICFLLDKLRAIALRRPAILPSIDMDPATMLPANGSPFRCVLRSLLELAFIQDAFLRILPSTSAPTTTQSHVQRADEIGHLVSRLNELRDSMASARAQPPHSTDLALRMEWLQVDYGLYATMTMLLHQAGSDSGNSQSPECVQNARLALTTLEQLAKPAKMSGWQTSYMPWSTLLYSSQPFMVLFCQVISSPDWSDLHLLQATADCITELGESVESVGHLQRLCNAMVSIARQSFPSNALEGSKEVSAGDVSMSNVSGSEGHDLHGAKTSSAYTQPGFVRDITVDSGIGPSTIPDLSRDYLLQETLLPNGTRIDDDEFWRLLEEDPALQWLNDDQFVAT